ncbi:hypothetical protein AB0C11_15925 [Streptomyces sp. NPDC039016]|uniref:hypothetical protein n=1 Tax=unclassified Streptomyces TaxID=2593676 RepID=UPI0033E8AB7D
MRRRGEERQGRPDGPERAARGRLRGRRGTAFGVAVVVGVAALALLLVMCGAEGGSGERSRAGTAAVGGPRTG